MLLRAMFCLLELSSKRPLSPLRRGLSSCELGTTCPKDPDFGFQDGARGGRPCLGSHSGPHIEELAL